MPASARDMPGCTGGAIATAGELLRIWAAGHIEKGREITRSGPYGFVRHPLYLGSTGIGLGFVGFRLRADSTRLAEVTPVGRRFAARLARSLGADHADAGAVFAQLSSLPAIDGHA